MHNRFITLVLLIFLFRYLNCIKVYDLSEFCKNTQFKWLESLPYTKSILMLNSSASVHQTFNFTHFKRFRSDCEFKVNTSSKKSGLIAFIQKLNLRKNLTNGNCIDYLKIIYSDKIESEEICGEFGTIVNKFRSFDEKNGKMRVNVNIDKSKELKYDEVLEVNLVFTAYSECLDNSKNQFACHKTRDKSEMCIDSLLEKDGQFNCPTPFCSDEKGCSIIEKTKINHSNVAISALTSLIFTMIGVGFCIWVCFKHRVCISQCTETSNRVPRVPSNIEMQTAANISENRRPNNHKDLPPSYDSLFPTDR